MEWFGGSEAFWISTVLRPVHFERVDLLGADIAGDERRIVQEKAQTSLRRALEWPRGPGCSPGLPCSRLCGHSVEDGGYCHRGPGLSKAPKNKDTVRRGYEVSKPIGDPTTSDHF